MLVAGSSDDSRDVRSREGEQVSIPKALLFYAFAFTVFLLARPSGPADAGEAAPDPSAKPRTTRLQLTEGLTAELDSRGGLSVSRGKQLLLTGGIAIAGKTAAVVHSGLSAEEISAPGALGAWSLRSRPECGNARIEIRAQRSADALALACRVNFRQPESVSSWGYVLRLPAAGNAGAELRVGGRSIKLPATAGGKRSMLLLRGRARSVVLLRAGKPVLRILRDVPASVTVRDLRPAGASRFEVVFTASRADLSGAAQGRFCLGLVAPGKQLKPLIYHARAWPPVRPGLPIRVEIGLLAEYRSAFDPSDVKVDIVVKPPDGRTHRHPAFYARQFSSRVETKVSEEDKKVAAAAAEIEGGKVAAVETEFLEPVGEPGWRALLDARKLGVYRITVEATNRAGQTAAAARPLRLVRSATARMGPLARSAKDSRYLVDPQGKPVFLLGHNLGWLVDKRGPLSLARWTAALERMKAAGLNYSRVWTCTWSLWTETGRPYRYDMASAWKLDRIIAEAAERGIHVQLCLDNFHDFRFKREKSPYFGGKKPVCKTTRDFFTSKAARRMYSARLRYMVARYGHHANLMAWELWNELDYCIEKKEKPEELQTARKEYLVPWVRSVARELAALDGRRRLITCSLADGTIWPELAGAPEIGLAESHIYLYMPAPKRGKPAYPARVALAEATAEFAKYGKPGFVSEFGFGSAGGDTSPINATDRLGVHLHNGLWSSALSGHAGAVALWWWDSYLAPPGGEQPAKDQITGEDRYWHYRALSRYLRGTNWLAGWKPLTVSPLKAGGRQPLITGLRTDQEVMVWIADPGNSWYNRAVKAYKPARITKAAFTVDGLQPGQYQITWWDTYAGKEKTSSRQLTDAAGSLRVRVPAFSRDVAARIKLIKRSKPAAE
jgi:Cellulase (glycosyl hydrolase family 5)